MNTREISTFQHQLLIWFEEEFRDMPWRETRDPYSIWIAEIMLQQTQVKTVIPYYQRFLNRFPTIESLATADLNHVLKLWEGLGYYARARNLFKAAQIIVEEYDGMFPNSMDEVIQLPGIGPYTAAAILSIAFDFDYPVLDGNVKRVLSRLFRLDVFPQSREGMQQFEEKAKHVFARGRAGQFNQAMMELGALICTPRSPKCLLCPVQSWCLALQAGVQERYPLKPPTKKRPHKKIAAGIVWRDGLILIDQRKEDAMLGGLWEFPGGQIENSETPEQAVVREVKEELDVEVKVIDFFTSVEHQYTHFTITLFAYHCCYESGDPKAIGCQDWRWVRKEDLPALAFPRANTKLIEQLLQESPEGQDFKISC